MPTSRIGGGRGAVVFMCWTGVLILLVAGCAVTGGKHENSRRPLAGPPSEQAARLLDQVLEYDARGQWRQVVTTAGTMLDYHRDDPRCSRALAVAVPAALRLGDGREALGLARIYQDEFGTDAELVPTLLGAVDLALGAADTLTAATFEVLAFKSDPTAVLASGGAPGPVPLLDALRPAQLARLADAFAGSETAAMIGYHRVRALLREGRRQEARDLASALVVSAPGDPWAGLADDLATGRREMERAANEGAPPVLGLLAPLSGRYAGYGTAMQEAAHLALNDAEPSSARPWRLEVLDTGGDPVLAAKAARALCAEPGIAVLVGALRTGTTVAAALVADRAGVPLVSPTASNEQIESLGPDIYQTNMSDNREIRQLAELAVRVLAKQRTAILGPDSPNGRHLAGLFRDQVEALGGQVVAQSFFPPAVTDFRAQIMEVRLARPEVVFVPVSFEQMALLGPQLDFYHLGSLVMGPSSWSMARPSRQQAASLEGCVFPDAQARFSPTWTTRFKDQWDTAAFSVEQTDVAQLTYLAIRQVMSASARSGTGLGGSLAEALTRQFRRRGLVQADSLDLASLAGSLILVRAGKSMPFPADLFAATVVADLPAAGAAADSLEQAQDSPPPSVTPRSR